MILFLNMSRAVEVPRGLPRRELFGNLLKVGGGLAAGATVFELTAACRINPSEKQQQEQEREKEKRRKEEEKKKDQFAKLLVEQKANGSVVLTPDLGNFRLVTWTGDASTPPTPTQDIPSMLNTITPTSNLWVSNLHEPTEAVLVPNDRPDKEKLYKDLLLKVGADQTGVILFPTSKQLRSLRDLIADAKSRGETIGPKHSLAYQLRQESTIVNRALLKEYDPRTLDDLEHAGPDALSKTTVALVYPFNI